MTDLFNFLYFCFRKLIKLTCAAWNKKAGEMPVDAQTQNF